MGAKMLPIVPTGCVSGSRADRGSPAGVSRARGSAPPGGASRTSATRGKVPWDAYLPASGVNGVRISRDRRVQMCCPRGHLTQCDRGATFWNWPRPAVPPFRRALGRRCIGIDVHSMRRSIAPSRLGRLPEVQGATMTTKNPDKSAARTLAALTGRPYQSCLSVVAVLRDVPADIDIGELADLVAGRPIETSGVELPVCLFEETRLNWGDGDAIWMTEDDPAYVRGHGTDDDAAEYAVRLSGSGIDLLPDNELWLTNTVEHCRVREGTWRLGVRDLLDGMRRAESIPPPTNPYASRDDLPIKSRGVRIEEPLFDFAEPSLVCA